MKKAKNIQNLERDAAVLENGETDRDSLQARCADKRQWSAKAN